VDIKRVNRLPFSSRNFCLQYFYADIPEPDRISVILEIDMAGFGPGETGHFTEFAARHQFIPLFVPERSGNHQHAIQKKIQGSVIQFDFRLVPFAYGMDGLAGRCNEIIQVAGPVFMDPAVGMPLVIQDLHFRAR
jgi:hypothetical protein